MTQLGIHLVAVHTTQTNGDAVDKEAALTVGLQTAEAHALVYLLHDLADRIGQHKAKGVEVGILSSPFMRVLDVGRQPAPFGVAALGRTVVHDGGTMVEVEHGGGIGGKTLTIDH